MKVLDRLLKVGSIGQSIGVYLPATIIQKVLGIGRLILFMSLFGKTNKGDFGLWAVSLMILMTASPLLTLGTHHSLIRYVSFFEMRGRLRWFYHRIMLLAISAIVILSAGALLGRNLIAHYIIAPQSLAVTEYHLGITVGVVLNLALMALYLNVLSFLSGLRVYRLMAVVELWFSIVFTVVALVWIRMDLSALTLLKAHALSLGCTIVPGWLLLHLGIQRISGLPLDEIPEIPPEIEPAPDSDDVAMEMPLRVSPSVDQQAMTKVSGMHEVILFGMWTLVSSLIWHGASYVGFWVTHYRYKETVSAQFFAYQRLCQIVLILSNAAWAIILTHIVKRWDSGRRESALFTMETAFKAISLTIMSMLVLQYVTSPLWTKILHETYREDAAYLHYLPGMMMFIMTLCNLSLLTALAKLHERPGIIAMAALAGGSLIGLLAGVFPHSWGMVGPARAMGVGMFVGGGFVLLIFMQAARVKLGRGTMIILGIPPLLLAPWYIVGPLWVLLILASVFTTLIFTPIQKQTLRAVSRNLWNSMFKRQKPA